VAAAAASRAVDGISSGRPPPAATPKTTRAPRAGAEVFKYFTEIKPLAAYALGVTIVCQGNRVVLEIFEIRAKRESREAEEADARASKAAAKGGNPKKKR